MNTSSLFIRFRTGYCRLLIFTLIFAAAVLSISGCSTINSYREKNAVISDTGFYFDTVVKLTIYGSSDTTILNECFSEMERYESLLSRTREGSDIWKINHSHGQTVTVSDTTAGLLKRAIYFSELSEGAFDPTIAPVISLWNFTENPDGILPDHDSITKALSHVNYRLIEVNGTSVTLKDPEASIDLGGIAKGYIADQLKDFLIKKNITSALINLGGNNLAVGTKPDRQPWKIGIKKPFGDTSEFCTILEVDGQSVVTSGCYERYFINNEKIYHHLLNTDTGYPVDTRLHGVTILSDSSCDGDALSTICFTLGLEKGLQLIETLPDTEALFVTEDGDIHKSSGFPE